MKQDNLEKAAKFIAVYLGTLDPAYKDRIEILKSERQFTDLQALGSLICYALDNGQHLLVPNHPFFQGGELVGGTGEERTCACGEKYLTAYPGQPYHSNACAQKYRPDLQNKVQ